MEEGYGSNQRQVRLIQPVTEPATPLLPTAEQQRAALAPHGTRAVLRAVCIVMLLPFMFGTTLGFTSPALDGLARALALGPTQRAAFSSLVNVGAMATSIGSGRIADAAGRRPVLAASAALGLSGFLLIASAESLGLVALFVGRLLTGCAAGAASVVVNVYVAEVAPAHLRGSLGSLFQVTVTFGIFAAYLAGVWLDWRALALASTIPCLLLLCALPLVPETPRWLLLTRGDAAGARAAMVRLRGGAESGVDEELERLALPSADMLAADAGAQAAESSGYAPPRLESGAADGAPAAPAASAAPAAASTAAAPPAVFAAAPSDDGTGGTGRAQPREPSALAPNPGEALVAARPASGSAQGLNDDATACVCAGAGDAAAGDAAAGDAAAGDVSAGEAGAREAGERRGATAASAACRPSQQLSQPQRPESSPEPPTQRQRLEPWILRPLALSVVLMACQQGSGINAVIFYSQQILADANFVGFAPSAALIVAGAQAVVTACSVPLMDSVGRRPLLLLASAGMCASQAVISSFFLTGRRLPALALAGLCGSVSSFSLGLGAIPWSLMGELFPQSARGLASSVATLVNWSASFAVTLSFDALARALGDGGLFAAYAGVCGGTLLFVALFVPETKGRTLEEIERAFRRAGATGGQS
jgi:MFS family permease